MSDHSANDRIIEAMAVRKEYRTAGEVLEVLNELSIEVARGEFLAIQGASGVGKSTLLHILGGLDRPTRGRVKVSSAPGEPQVDLTSLSGSELNRFRGQQAGFVFQFHHLLPEFSAVENVLLPALIQGTSHDVAQSRAAELLDEVGVGDRKEHRPSQLSGGEAQRVAIARAMMNSPALLLLDEPTGNLDRERGTQIFDLIERIHSERRQTIIVVTHDPEIAARATRRLVLREGRLWGESFS